MAFTLKRKEPVPDGIRRVAADRIETARKLVSRARTLPITDAAVHDLRRWLKQVRGILRIAKPELGRRRFRQANRALRDAARPLAALRDATVMIETFDRLTDRRAAVPSPASLKRLRAALVVRRRTLRHEVLGKQAAPRAIERALSSTLRRIPDWPLKQPGWKAIEAGLRTTYGGGRKAMNAASRDGSDASFHEWRKRVKDLRYAIEFIAKADPRRLGAFVVLNHRLTDLLGEDHDLATLIGLLETEPALAEPGHDRDVLLSRLAKRRALLQKQAATVGGKVYRETPNRFVASIHRQWKAWR